VIHTAFIHDFSQWAANIEIDLQALKAMIGVLEGTGKPLISTSGLALHSPGQVCTEAVSAVRGAPRSDAEFEVLGAAERGVRSILVRLPPSVHGAGDHGFVPQLVEIARRKGVAAYVGDGANRWPAVHRTDAARAYRLALETAPAGTRVHAVAETGVPMRAIAETIGAGLGLPTRSLTQDEAAAHFEWFAMFAAIDCPASSAITRELLGWAPTGPDLLTDIRENGYFG
jgi:nucleoside-diphosphate-sugar epimerase